MSELEHSRRNMERATYTPIRAERDIGSGTHQRTWDKWSYMAAMSPSLRETARVIQRLTNGPSPIPKNQQKYLQIIQSIVQRPGQQASSLPLESAPTLADIPAELLHRFGEELFEIRKTDLDERLKAHDILSSTYQRAVQQAVVSPRMKAEIPAGYKIDPNFVRSDLPGAKLYRLEVQPISMAEAQTRRARAAGGPTPAPDAKGAAFEQARYAGQTPGRASPLRNHYPQCSQGRRSGGLGSTQ